MDLDLWVNKEQLLHLALEVQDKTNEDSEYGSIAKSIILWYVINKLNEDEETYAEEDIVEMSGELAFEHNTAKWINKGYVEQNLDNTYTFTESGKKYIKEQLDKEECNGRITDCQTS